MKTALLAAAALLALSIGTAYAGALDFQDEDSGTPVVTHHEWLMKCSPDDGNPYIVGWSSYDSTLQIKSMHGPIYTYRGHVSQMSRGTFMVVASRPDQNRSLVVTFSGSNSTLTVIGQNPDGSGGGTNACTVLGGRD
jgi:hypothetical protein